MATKNDLEDLMGKWEPARDAHESTLKRARRREVHRRLAVVILALAIFVIPAVLLFQSERLGPTKIAGTDAESPFALTYPGHNSDFAKTEGTLSITNGCVMLDRGQGEVTLLAWPTGTSVQVGGDGMTSVVMGDGSIVVVGEPLSVSGGSLSRPDSSEAFDQLSQDVPEACRTAAIWEVGEILGGGAS